MSDSNCRQSKERKGHGSSPENIGRRTIGRIEFSDVAPQCRF